MISPAVAYGDAAAAALEACTKPINKLNALVCYYPSSFPPSETGFPPNLKVMVHQALDSPTPQMACPVFTYPDAMRGFGEPGSAQYEKISTNLAWSRTLGLVRQGFGIEPDLEAIWDNHLARKHSSSEPQALLTNCLKSSFPKRVGSGDLLSVSADAVEMPRGQWRLWSMSHMSITFLRCLSGWKSAP